MKIKYKAPGLLPSPAWAKNVLINKVAFGSGHLLAGSVSFGQKLFGRQTFGWTCKKVLLEPMMVS
jgi:pentapeptide MXKDX repeat protein